MRWINYFLSCGVLSVGLLFSAGMSLNAETVIDFEDVSLPFDRYQYGVMVEGLSVESTAPWGAIYAVSGKRELDDLFVYWTNGDDTVVSGGGADGSDQWFSAYNYAPGDVVFVAPEGSSFRSVEINNVDLVDFAVRNGLYQARAFQPGDFLRVRFVGFEADETLTPTGATTEWIDLVRYDQQLVVLNEWTLIDLSSLGTNRVGFEFEGTDNDPVFGLNTPALLAVDNLVIVSPATIVQAFAVHTGWTGPGASIADMLDTETELLREGPAAQTAARVNMINSVQGINAVAFDCQSLPAPADLTGSDFQFQVSPQGGFDMQSNSPVDWSAAPEPLLISIMRDVASPGYTAGTVDRIMIQWADNAIRDRWVRITVRATVSTGLSQDQVYYLGHLAGETTGDVDGIYSVTFSDITPIRAQIGQTVSAGSMFDINKDGSVTFSDISAMRSSVGAQLTNITVPASQP